MQIKSFIEFYQRSIVIKKLTAYSKQSPTPSSFHLQGITGSLDALLITALYYSCSQTQLIILENKEEALALYGDLVHLLPTSSVLLYPSREKRENPSSEGNKIIHNKQIEILHKLNENQSVSAIVTDIIAFSEKIMDKTSIAHTSYRINQAQTLSLSALETTLKAKQFTKVDFVYRHGQFAIRGYIVDVFSTTNSFPYRIELWGNIVSSIRIFNPKDQKSFREVTTATILSNQEIETESTIYPTSFISYLPEGTCIWIKNPNKALEAVQKLQEDSTTKSSHPLPLSYESKENVAVSINSFHKIFFGSQPSNSKEEDEVIDYESENQPCFQQNFTRLAADITTRSDHGYHIWIAAISLGQLDRLHTILETKNPKPRFTSLLVCLREGFIDHTSKVICYTDHQIFNRYYRYRPSQGYSSTEALLTNEFKNFQIGDYVVHSDYGIGRFSGLHSLHINDHKQEVIRLVYKNNDIIYVSIHELHKISKYTSKEGVPPIIHTLGTSTWKNKKRAVKKQIKDIAKELITLYAQRKNSKGFAFGPDTVLDAQLADSFEYEETPDQARAIASVKEDMEKPSPMDRLICGDVGFGKTEIAIRAAFKAVQHGKQAAILVPTTLLAFQHYNSFIHRLSNLPVRVDYLNRFKTTQETKQTLQHTALGKVDILIGTHKLLSEEVTFKDLGLLVIDEEQKFGVSAKEKLKQLRSNIDTLTLAATPIPRTLHFSLMGARDLSILTTPPSNRQPIRTKLYHFNFEIIQEAIKEEIKRKGQALFMHNRISSIDAMGQHLSELLPTARICIAHGRMNGSTLEHKILQFITGHYDVLIATSIIESGIDIPNVNTIIINDSHLFGMADLHQIRGRVGRSHIQAFCYLLIPEEISLTPPAKLRLAALEEFSELGDGIKLAMRDLDIRGAGDLLGAAQSGFIADIGFDTYCQILEEAVEEVKHDDFKTLFSHENNSLHFYQNDCSIETDYEAFLPPDYVQNSSERMVLYTRLNELKDVKQLTSFKEELVDRFGPPPTVIETLMETVQLRWEAQRIGFYKLFLKNKSLRCYLGDNFQKKNPHMWDALIQYIQHNPMSCQLKKVDKDLLLTITSPVGSIAAAKDLLMHIGKKG